MTTPAAICPHWARFIFRSDGNWLAYCSKSECNSIESSRPGTMANTDFPREEKCKLGFSEYSSIAMPVIIWGKDLECHGYYHQEWLTEEEWDKMVEGFIADGPRRRLYDVLEYIY